jgi:hypothetical protein
MGAKPTEAESSEAEPVAVESEYAKTRDRGSCVCGGAVALTVAATAALTGATALSVVTLTEAVPPEAEPTEAEPTEAELT